MLLILMVLFVMASAKRDDLKAVKAAWMTWNRVSVTGARQQRAWMRALVVARFFEGAFVLNLDSNNRRGVDDMLIVRFFFLFPFSILFPLRFFFYAFLFL